MDVSYPYIHSDGTTTEDCESLMSKDCTPSTLRTGKWTREEELFTNRMISDFQDGVLEDCEEGCTLRCYLANKLHCSPMRISKKLAGLRMGKSVFRRKTPSNPDYNPNAGEISSAALLQLEREFNKGLVESYNSDGNERKNSNDCLESVVTIKSEDSITITESSSSMTRKCAGQKRAIKSSEDGKEVCITDNKDNTDEEQFKLPMHVCESSLNVHILDQSDIASLLELEPATKRQFLAQEGWGFYSDPDLIPLFGI